MQVIRRAPEAQRRLAPPFKVGNTIQIEGAESRRDGAKYPVSPICAEPKASVARRCLASPLMMYNGSNSAEGH